MDRRTFTRTSLTVAGAATVGSAFSVAAYAQTPEGSPAASPSTTSGVWESADEPVTIEFDAEIFGEAKPTAGPGETCVLRIEDIEHFLSFIISFRDDYPHQMEAARDYIENDPELSFPGQELELTRLSVVEYNGAVGTLYKAPAEGSEDRWSFTQMIPSEDPGRRSIEVWVQSRVSKLDRELMEKAVGSVLINGEPAVRAIGVSELFDQIEEIEVAE